MNVRLDRNIVVTILLAVTLAGCALGTCLVWGTGLSWTERGFDTGFGKATLISSIIGLLAIVYRAFEAINSVLRSVIHVFAAAVSLGTIVLYYMTRVGADDPYLADGHRPIRGEIGLTVSFLFVLLYIAVLTASGAMAKYGDSTNRVGRP